MSQTLQQRRELKVVIGSKYSGPVLEETKPVKKPLLSPDAWVAVAVFFGWLFAIAQTLAQVN